MDKRLANVVFLRQTKPLGSAADFTSRPFLIPSQRKTGVDACPELTWTAQSTLLRGIVLIEIYGYCCVLDCRVWLYYMEEMMIAFAGLYL